MSDKLFKSCSKLVRSSISIPERFTEDAVFLSFISSSMPEPKLGPVLGVQESVAEISVISRRSIIIIVRTYIFK